MPRRRLVHRNSRQHTDLTLVETQLRFAEAIIATGKPVVLVMVEGRPRIISRIADRVSAILMAYNPSNEGGRAVADVLFGDYNPGGKLPFTYPRSPNNYLPTITSCSRPKRRVSAICRPASVRIRHRTELHDLRLQRSGRQPGVGGNEFADQRFGQGDEHRPPCRKGNGDSLCPR